jgi:hypothetical protein
MANQRAIVKGERPTPNFRDGYRMSQIADAILRSGETQIWTAHRLKRGAREARGVRRRPGLGSGVQQIRSDRVRANRHGG